MFCCLNQILEIRMFYEKLIVNISSQNNKRKRLFLNSHELDRNPCLVLLFPCALHSNFIKDKRTQSLSVSESHSFKVLLKKILPKYQNFRAHRCKSQHLWLRDEMTWPGYQSMTFVQMVVPMTTQTHIVIPKTTTHIASLEYKPQVPYDTHDC